MMRGASPYAAELGAADRGQRSVDWWVMSEDLPDPANRVTIDASGNIMIIGAQTIWRPMTG